MTAEEIREIIERGEAPVGLRAGLLDFSGSDRPLILPAGLQCHSLKISGRAIRELPADLRVDFKLDASNCTQLAALPPDFRVPVLNLRGCAALRALPEGLQVDYLDMQDCVALAEWPASAQVTIGTVNARNCRTLRALPPGIGPLTSPPRSLGLCASFVRASRGWWCAPGSMWPGPGFAACRTRSVVPGCAGGASPSMPRSPLPETIEAQQILAESNAEVRRVMIERVGFERFLKDVNAEVLHRDKDPGGPRELLRVKLTGDEDLVCVSVRCPSTGRHYLIRVPPTMRTCRQAVAWTAGFDNPDEYRPELET